MDHNIGAKINSCSDNVTRCNVSISISGIAIFWDTIFLHSLLPMYIYVSFQQNFLTFLTAHKESVLKGITKSFFITWFIIKKFVCTNISQQQIFKKEIFKKVLTIYNYLSVLPLMVVQCIYLPTFIEIRPTVAEMERALKIQYGCHFHGNMSGKKSNSMSGIFFRNWL